MKKYLVIILIVGIYILVALSSENLLNNNEYLFVGQNAKWIYKNGEWSNMTSIPDRFGKYELYNGITGDLIKKSNIYYKNNRLISEDKNIYDNNFVIAHKGKSKFTLISYDVDYNVGSKEVLEVLKKLGINQIEIPSASKIVLDLDNDGEYETLYELYNSGNNNYEYDAYYSIICIKDNNEYIKLAYNISNSNFDYSYAVSFVMDIKKDGDYEILINKRNNSFDEKDISYSLYGLKDGSYVKLVGTE